MKNIKLLNIIVVLLILTPLYSRADKASDRVPVLIMCRPTVGQIKNIEVLKSEGLLGNGKLKLLCVYHKNELTDYAPSRNYVKVKGLGWVSFVKIKGSIRKAEIFKKNIWTSQFREIFDISDGIIFTGGMDIPPDIYRQNSSLLSVATTPYRTLYESSFLFHLIGGNQNEKFHPFLEDKPEYPILGICLGSQTMNIAAGGTLVQDIPSEIYKLKYVEQVLKQSKENIHSSRYMKALFPESSKDIAPVFHGIKVNRASILLKKIMGNINSIPSVLSSHHQSAKIIGKDLFIAATSMDGRIVEAIEHKKFKNVLGVQFHPEYRYLYRGLRFVTNHPISGNFFSIKNFLAKNVASLKFHKNLWKWFAVQIRR